MSENRVSWLAWAKNLEGLTPTDALVARELARLADWRGESICSVAWLVQQTGRHRASVLRSLSHLEEMGALLRQRRYGPGTQGRQASRIMLLAAPRPCGPDDVLVCHFPPMPEVSREGPVVTNGEELRQALVEAIEQGWCGGRGTELVARSLVVGVHTRMAKVVRKGQAFAGMSWQESVMDTTSWAWEALRLNESRIVQADDPWGMWTTITQRATGERDAAPADGTQIDLVEPLRLPQADVALPGELTVSAERVGIGDFEGVLTMMVEALIEAGMPQEVAWAGTRRIVELSLKGGSRRHTLAGEDHRLTDLGVDGACGRAWMTMLVGSRRGTKTSVLEASPEEVRGRAEVVVEAFKEASFT